jgi:hypothetical protein
MGTGIMAAIPLVLQEPQHWKLDQHDFAPGFFDNYTLTEGFYTLASDILLENYRSFLIEFYELIEDDLEQSTKLTPETIPDVNSLDEFKEVFNSGIRNRWVPHIDNDPYLFSTLGCNCYDYWLFYFGSYKAILEEYATLVHFEKVLAKAMQNPLRTAVKFGIFG